MKFTLAFKKVLNLLLFSKPTANPPTNNVDMYLNGENSTTLLGLNSDGSVVVLATGSK